MALRLYLKNFKIEVMQILKWSIKKIEEDYKEDGSGV